MGGWVSVLKFSIWKFMYQIHSFSKNTIESMLAFKIQSHLWFQAEDRQSCPIQSISWILWYDQQAEKKPLKCSEKCSVSERGWELTMIHDDVYQFIFWVRAKAVQTFLIQNGIKLKGEENNLVFTSSNRQWLDLLSTAK